METTGYFLLIPLIINSVMALLLYIRGKQAYQRINRAFALWVITICFWYFQLINQTLTVSGPVLLVLFRLSLLGEFVIPSAFLYFVFCFTHEKLTRKKRWFLLAPAIFFFLLVLLDMTNIKLVVNTIRYSGYGDMGRSVIYRMTTFLAWFLYFVWYSSWGVILLIGHLWRTTVAIHSRHWHHVRRQANFLLAAIGVVVFIFGLTVDIILPIFKSRIFPVSSITTLIMVGLMTWLLLRVERN